MTQRRNFIKASILGISTIPLTGFISQKKTGEESYNILSWGARPDGKTLNTGVIQQAIDACSADGGGTVLFPAGNYVTGSLFLKSGVTIHLAKGATLLGSTDTRDYTPVIPEFSALRTNSQACQLLFAENQENISIIGEGCINGQGAVFKRGGTGDEGTTRPHGIQLIGCRNVKVEGITLMNSGAWMQHYLACEHLRITGIRVFNHCNYNNDGIDIDSCCDVIISDCIVDSDDDGICLKSTSPRICENVLVNNCTVRSFCNALKLGTESTGGFRNIVISNCTVTPCEPQKRYYGYELGESAISLEMVDGGMLEQVTVNNITILDTGCPIFIKLGNRARKYAPDAPEPGMGVLRNVRISNIMATTTSITTSSITAIPGYFAENIHLDNITLYIDNTGKKEFAGMEVPENDAGYPTARMYGEQLPAAAFFVRHVKNIRFSNVHIVVGKDNYLPVLVLDNVENAKLLFPELQAANGNELIRKTPGCKDISIVTA